MEKIYNKAAYINQGRSVGGFRIHNQIEYDKNAHYLGVFFVPNKKIFLIFLFQCKGNHGNMDDRRQ